MNFNEYQELAARTAKQQGDLLVEYGLGITGESGEVADIIKKVKFHGHSEPVDNIEKELGDVLWYLSQIARIVGLTLEEVAVANIEKLKKRYPDGFSSEKSINREE